MFFVLRGILSREAGTPALFQIVVSSAYDLAREWGLSIKWSSFSMLSFIQGEFIIDTPDPFVRFTRVPYSAPSFCT